uniref:Uncharacterized protein n=1 Tax=Arion vulgaris TaxID=1028688 RepID=A0A0B6Z5H5_9EUPU
MMAGIKFSLTCLTSHAGHMVQTTLRLSEFRSMQTAEFEGFTSQIGYIQKMSYQQSSSFTFLCNRKNNADITFKYI